ncbi:MAG: peptidylprolyl isomerase [Sedimentisphaerales bacterium]|nr:peptidylprolyl isomerase [Sedimentisphaerales bacterium]
MALVVNGERIDDNEITREVERLRPRHEQVFAQKDAQERETQLQEWSRENVIERALLRQEARKESSEVPAAEIETALANLRAQFEKPEQLYAVLGVENDDQAAEAIRRQIQAERKIDEVYARVGEPSEDEIRKFYEKNKDRFTSDEQVRVAHIVKYVNWQTSEAEALETLTHARKEIESGTSFEMIVDKYSDCADSGGDLGFVARGQMVEEFEDVVFKLAPGQVSDVFRTRFGFHLAKVYSQTPPRQLELKEVKTQVLNELKEQMREQALGDYLDGLRRQATVEEI